MLMIFWWWWLIFLSFFPSLPESLSLPPPPSPLSVQAEIEEVKREVFTIKLQRELTFAHIF